jgi:tetratricopeptide (TPR) repeat protein
MRLVIERVFQRLTEAHDTLTSGARRVAYDATLPPARRPATPPPASPDPPPAKKATRPRLSKAMKAVRPSQALKRTSSKLLSAKKASTAKLRRAPTPAAMPAPARTPERTPERREQLRNAAMEIRAQVRIDMLVEAAEKAVKENDPVSAETNYRLALQHREDSFIRQKLETIEVAARIIRFEKNLAAGKSAERAERWQEAAQAFIRAHDARADADAAARAARALRLASGDLERAGALADEAVSLDPRNVGHRITLIEVHLAANEIEEAEDEVDELARLAPKDERVRSLAAIVAKAAKARRH